MLTIKHISEQELVGHKSTHTKCCEYYLLLSKSESYFEVKAFFFGCQWKGIIMRNPECGPVSF